jgi:hypothetical protein
MSIRMQFISCLSLFVNLHKQHFVTTVIIYLDPFTSEVNFSAVKFRIYSRYRVKGDKVP